VLEKCGYIYHNKPATQYTANALGSVLFNVQGFLSGNKSSERKLVEIMAWECNVD
jgi:hypothetical protein